MKQRIQGLGVQFACPSTVEDGDVVMLSGVKAVCKVNVAGSLNVVGDVTAHREDGLVCTVDTKFRYHCDDRLSGAAIAAVGPFVWDAEAKVIPYNENVHSVGAICGLVITMATNAGQIVETLEY